MINKAYIIDRVLHWISAFLLLFMLMNLSTQLHNVDWEIKGQIEHRQDAVQLHAVIGIILVGITIVRLCFSSFANSRIKRIIPKSRKHAIFMSVTHIALYTSIFLLAATGLVLINNYEIPLVVFGIEFPPNRDAYYGLFPTIHGIHMFLKQSIWWLIAIHFAGVIAKK